MNTLRLQELFFSTLLCFAIPASAHHSVSNFDSSKTATVTGTVTYVSFTNPHSFFDVDVESSEGTTEYKIFATSRVVLLRYGWRPDSVEVGDTITIEGRPDRQDPTQLYLLRITFADGSEWSRDEVLL